MLQLIYSNWLIPLHALSSSRISLHLLSFFRLRGWKGDPIYFSVSSVWWDEIHFADLVAASKSFHATEYFFFIISVALFQQRLCAWPKGSWLLWLWHEWTGGAMVCIQETCTCLAAFVLRLTWVCLTFTWIVNQVGFALLETQQSVIIKMGFAPSPPLSSHRNDITCYICEKCQCRILRDIQLYGQKQSGLWSVPAAPGCRSS